jgi:hypothetical protein
VYRELNPDKILDTLDALAGRITARFPGSGLSEVSAELCSAAREIVRQSMTLGQPHWPVRVVVGAATAALAAVAAAALVTLRMPAGIDGVADLVQTVEAAVSDLVFLAVGIYFLWTLENRIKRGRALRGLHQLRCIAHVVDMHQLTKDPDPVPEAPPAGDPSPPLASRLELAKYLDYCSELLSLTSKLAALHVQRFNDPTVLGAVNDVEELTEQLSRKIWQKITILDMAGPEPPAARGGALQPAPRAVLP